MFESQQFASIIERCRYDYLQQMVTLRRQISMLKSQVEQARRLEEHRFPRNLEDFRSKDLEMQVRVGRFLMGDERKREQMRDESQWAHRATQPLMEEYNRNVS